MLRTEREELHKAVENKQSTAQSTEILQALLQALRDLRVSPVPGIVLEAALLQLCESDVTANIVQKPKKEETTAVKEKPKAGQPESVPEKKEDPAPKATIIEAPVVSMETLKEHWNDIVNSTTPASVKMSLKNGHVTAIDGKNITISFASSFHKSTVAKTESSQQVEKVLQGIFKQPLRITCIVDQEGEPLPSAPTEEAVNIAEAAAEVF